MNRLWEKLLVWGRAHSPIPPSGERRDLEVGSQTPAMPLPELTIGNKRIAPPEGWTLISQTDDKIVLSSPRQQHATISRLGRFNTDPTFDTFKTLCEIHTRAAQKLVPNGFVDPDPPFQDGAAFGMCFFGGDQNAGLVFFGYLCLSERELISIFVEGTNINVQDHGNDFRIFVKGLKRNWEAACDCEEK